MRGRHAALELCQDMANLPKYVLITPARNEAEFIGSTIESVIAQTVRPVKWVIVSDGSTDGTDDIVKKYAAVHPWIELVRTPERKERHFAGKVHAFNAGYERVKDVAYEVIASLDADITFDADYFAFLLQKLVEDPKLGLVGTPFVDYGSNKSYDYRFVSIEHVSGACQVFRRECFESVGGYIPVKGGCIDHIAVIGARMKGWKTRTFPEKTCFHHRTMGTAQDGTLAMRFKYGRKDYMVGGHPLFEVFRVLYQMTKPPYLIGGVLIGAGYVSATLKRLPRPVPAELVEFYRREQMNRLKRFFGSKSTVEYARSSSSASQAS
jgi:poly-beta-1,6-N-acetyl-D-glucosamine synthase